MRGQRILFISLGLNAILAIFLIAHRHRGTPVDPPATNSQVADTNVKTRVVVRKQFFAWQELESSDYQAYITHLREIGCPAQTIRDIIIADVNQLFAKRRLAEVPTADQQWWRAEPDTNFVQAASAKALALDQERRDLLKTLLGPNWDTAEIAAHPPLALNGPLLGELSPETKNAVQEIIARSQQRTKDYLDAQKAAGGKPSPAELARLNQQTRTELAQVLNPAQLEEFLLRYSDTASSLRLQLKGIDLSPEEFRNLFRITDPLDQQIQLASGTTDERNLQLALGKQIVEALQNVLGPDRYQAYRMNLDPAYRDAVNLANDAGAPPEAITALYRLNQAVLQEQNRIRNDPTLTDDQRKTQLAALDQQQQNASDQILGLAPAPPPPAPPLPPGLDGMQVHQYSPGETIDQIAAQYGVTSLSILNANPNLNFNNLSRGAPIGIPRPQQ